MPRRKRQRNRITTGVKIKKEKPVKSFDWFFKTKTFSEEENDDDLDNEVPPPGWKLAAPPPKSLSKKKIQKLSNNAKLKAKLGRNSVAVVSKTKNEKHTLTPRKKNDLKTTSSKPVTTESPCDSPTKCIICGIDISKMKIHRGRMFQKQVENWKYHMLKNEGVSSKNKNTTSNNNCDPCESCYKQFVLESWNISEQINSLQLKLQQLIKTVIENKDKWSQENQNHAKLDELEENEKKDDDDDSASSGPASSSNNEENSSDSEYDPSEDLKLKNRKRRKNMPAHKSKQTAGSGGIKKEGHRVTNNVVKMEPPETEDQKNNDNSASIGPSVESINPTTMLQVKMEEKPNVEVVLKTPLIIPGYDAVCSHCGTTSRNLEHCEFCRALIPKTAKIRKAGSTVRHLKSDLNLETMKFPEDSPPPSHNIRIKDEMADDDDDGLDDNDSTEMPMIKIRKIESLCNQDFDA